MEVLDRLELRGDETVLDAGCGSGRVTGELIERLPSGRLLAVDGSEAMVAEGARAARRPRLLPGRRPLRAGGRRAGRPDLLDRHLPLDPRSRSPLRPPARGAATRRSPRRPVRRAGQRRRARAGDRGGRRARPSSPRHFGGMTGIWNFAGAEETEAQAAQRRLRRGPLLAGAEAGQPPSTRSSSPRPSPSARTWPSCRRSCAARSPRRSSRSRDQPLTLDYVRLNIEARAAA